MRSLLLTTLLLFGCEKITVLECDGHVADGSLDGGVDEDTGAGDSGRPDGTVEGDGGMPDGGDLDGGTLDGGSGCAGAGYCIDAIQVSQEVANVREMVVLTPMVSNPGGEALMFSGTAGEIATERRPELPAADLADIEITFVVDPGTGEAQLTVTEVPTWFATTTFVVPIHASAAGGPDVSAEARVTVRGNVLVSGSSAVYAIASDGAPARSENFSEGRLLSGGSFVDEPEDLLLARDGTLLVYDDGASPPRIRRFAMDGENSHVGDFQTDDGGMPIIDASQTGIGMTQLADGRVVLVDYNFSRTVESRIHIWNEDGSYSHSFNAPDNLLDWSGVAADDTGKLFVLEKASAGRLVEIDPDTGFEQGVVTTDISNGYNVFRTPDGYFYVGLLGSMLRVTPQGGKQMVSGLPSTGSSYSYRYVAPFGDGIVAGLNRSSSSMNVLVIEGTDFVKQLRRENVGGPSLTPYGIAWLD